MSYGDFKEVNGVIAEREYAVGKTITTTGVTSCIIVAAKVGADVFGIHLSIVGSGGSQFGVDDAQKVVDILKKKGADPSSAHIFGEITMWTKVTGYPKLLELLGIWDSAQWHEKSGNLTITGSDV